MANKIQIHPVRHIVIFLITLCLFIPQSKAQLIDRMLENFNRHQNISYTAFMQNKDLFSDDVFLDTLYATQTLKTKPTFKLKGDVEEAIFDGHKIFKLNHKDSTYRIGDQAKQSYYYDKSLSYLMAQFNAYVKRGKKAIQLRDSIYKGKSYFQLKITDLDSMVKGKKIYSINRLLIDKKTYLPVFYRNDSGGFIDGTDMYLKIFNEYHFSNFQINRNDLIDLSQTILPVYFRIEKPKVPMPLLEKGIQAPALTIVDLKGKPTEISAYKGKIVLLNFTISGCPHCIEAIDMLNALSLTYKENELVILSINPFDDTESILKYNDRFKQHYPTFQSAKSTKETYRINGYPTFYILNTKGEIVKGYEGFSKPIGELIKGELSSLIQQK